MTSTDHALGIIKMVLHLYEFGLVLLSCGDNTPRTSLRWMCLFISQIIAALRHYSSNRFCAISPIDSNKASILLINVYLPTDYGTSLSEFEFVSLLSELEAFADTHPHDFIVIGGDFNVDFRRTCRNTIALSNFMSQLHLCSADSLFHSYTYLRDDHSTSHGLTAVGLF